MKNNSKSWNIIYAFSIDNIEYDGYLKIGETSIDANSLDYKEVSKNLIEKAAKKRIKEIITTPGLNAHLVHAELALRKYKDQFIGFSDREFHHFLENNNVLRETPRSKNNINYSKSSNSIKSKGREWFKIDANSLTSYWKSFINGNDVIIKNPKIELRHEQQEASNEITKSWLKCKDNKPSVELKNKFLLNAIMRFGKCITTYDFINKNNIEKTLILTHRPVVKNSWKDDFQKIFKNENDQETLLKKYSFSSKEEYEKLSETEKKTWLNKKNIIYFSSIQNMRGIEYEKDKKGNFIFDENGHKIPKYDENDNVKYKESNKDIFLTEWDLVVVDEAHEGNKTTIAELMHKEIKRKFTLFLSGTPYNIMYDNDFEKDFGKNIYEFDYLKENELKDKWEKEESGDHSPYYDIPSLSILGIDILKSNIEFAKKQTNYEKTYFDFKLFFQLDENDNFVDEKNIIKWLNNITSDEKSELPQEQIKLMPFNKINRFQTQHSLWVMPKDIKKAKALEKLLNEHEYFKKHGYKIFNIAGDSYKEDVFKEIIDYTNQEDKCSITLSINRLTQGVTVPGWSAVLLLNNSSSAISYFQTIFRVKSPSPKHWKTRKTKGLIFDFNPDRTLDIISEQINLFIKRNYSNKELNIQDEAKIKRTILNYYNVMIFEDNNFKKVDEKILDHFTYRIAINRIVNNGFDSKELIDITKFNEAYNTNPEDIKNFLDKIWTKSGSKKIDINKINKITDNELDIKIIGNNQNESSIQESNSDLSNEDKKSKRKKLLDEKKKCRIIIHKIFTRLPFMLIGKSDEIIKKYSDGLNNFTAKEFCNFFNDEDWKEIMQEFSKNDFIDFTNKIINQQKFNGSCEKYINRIYNICKITNPLEKQKEWIELFEFIKNPDSETVITPWNVVQSHCKTLELDWKNSVIQNSTFLEINSKSAFYPLYIASKLYESQDELKKKKWADVLKNIFIICRTNLTKNVALKILNYEDDSQNVIVYDIVKTYRDLEEKSENEERYNNIICEIMSKFKRKDLKVFDFCISNPPYQQPINSYKPTTSKSSANNIYDKFVLLGSQISKISCMIFPAKWMTGGKGLDNFRKIILNSKHIKYLIDCPDYKKFFKTIDLDSGLTILVIDNSNVYNKTKIMQINDSDGENSNLVLKSERVLNEYDILIIDQDKYKILQTIEKKLNIFNDKSKWKTNLSLENYISETNPFGIGTNFYNSESDSYIDYSENKTEKNNIKIHYMAIKINNKNKNSIGNRTFAWISKDSISKNIDFIDGYKICMPTARGGGAIMIKIFYPKLLLLDPEKFVAHHIYF